MPASNIPVVVDTWVLMYERLQKLLDNEDVPKDDRNSLFWLKSNLSFYLRNKSNNDEIVNLYKIVYGYDFSSEVKNVHIFN